VTELSELRTRYEAFQADGIALYAVSVDSVYSHHAFAESLGGLPFELLADFERTVVTEWGVRRDDVAGYAGMPLRTVFVLDRDAVVRWRWVRSKDEPLPDPDEVLVHAREVAGALSRDEASPEPA
jgi:peroxiredoxin (alkyl hydroperoxide reductase subunit C)